MKSNLFVLTFFILCSVLNGIYAQDVEVKKIIELSERSLYGEQQNVEFFIDYNNIDYPEYCKTTLMTAFEYSLKNAHKFNQCIKSKKIERQYDIDIKLFNHPIHYLSCLKLDKTELINNINGQPSISLTIQFRLIDVVKGDIKLYESFDVLFNTASMGSICAASNFNDKMAEIRTRITDRLLTYFPTVHKVIKPAIVEKEKVKSIYVDKLRLGVLKPTYYLCYLEPTDLSYPVFKCIGEIEGKALKSDEPKYFHFNVKDGEKEIKLAFDEQKFLILSDTKIGYE